MEKKIQRFKAKRNKKTEGAIKLRKVLFNRLIVIVLLLLLQLLIFILVSLNLQKWLTYYVWSSILISIFFLMYLVNLSGKNEFKIAWILPVLVMPVFGISLYFMYRYNQGGMWLKHKIKKVMKASEQYIPSEKAALEVSRKFKEVHDLSKYLYTQGKNPPFADCSTKYYRCGEDFFVDVLADMKKAKKFIFIEFFIVEPCKIMDSILEVLSKKVKEGVQVRILFDSIGSISLSSSLLKDYFTSYGIESKIWLKFIPVFNTGLNNRDHRKIISIDGKTAYTGGVNISDEYANIYSKRFDYWKDAGIRITGKAVHTFTLMFLQMWNSQNKMKEPVEDFSRYISVGNELELSKPSIDVKKGLVIPYGDDAYNDVDLAENVYRYILIKSENRVCIMTPYVIIDNSILDDLVFAAQRGVKVELIVPQFYDHFISFCVGRTYIKNLIENGVKVYAYQKGFIHSKVFIGDSKMGTVGSVNLDYRSFFHHFECGAFMYKTESIKDIQKDFDNTKLESKEITIEEYKKIPLRVRAVGWIFRIFAPLM